MTPRWCGWPALALGHLDGEVAGQLSQVLNAATLEPFELYLKSSPRGRLWRHKYGQMQACGMPSRATGVSNDGPVRVSTILRVGMRLTGPGKESHLSPGD